MDSVGTSRASRAPSKICLPCQRRKVSCDLKRPICTACTACAKYRIAPPRHLCEFEPGAPTAAEVTKPAVYAEPVELVAGRTRAETRAINGVVVSSSSAQGASLDSVRAQQEDADDGVASAQPAITAQALTTSSEEPPTDDVIAGFARAIETSSANIGQAFPPTSEPAPRLPIPPSPVLPELPTFPGRDIDPFLTAAVAGTPAITASTPNSADFAPPVPSSAEPGVHLSMDDASYQYPLLSAPGVEPDLAFGGDAWQLFPGCPFPFSD